MLVYFILWYDFKFLFLFTISFDTGRMGEFVWDLGREGGWWCKFLPWWGCAEWILNGYEINTWIEYSKIYENIDFFLILQDILIATEFRGKKTLI